MKKVDLWGVGYHIYIYAMSFRGITRHYHERPWPPSLVPSLRLATRGKSLSRPTKVPRIEARRTRRTGGLDAQHGAVV